MIFNSPPRRIRARLLAVAISAFALWLVSARTAATATLTVTPKSISFGSEIVLPPNGQSSKVRNVTLRVSKTQPTGVTISGISSDSTEFAIQPYVSPTPFVISPGNSFSVGVVFTPNSTDRQTGHITVTSDASNSSVKINLSGVGRVGVISLSPGSVRFAKTAAGGVSAPKTIMLTNKNPIALPAPVISVSGPFGKPTDTCGGGAVSAKSSCQVTINFQPITKGNAAGNVAFTDVAARSPQKVKLLGVGLPGQSPTPTATATTTATPTPTPTSTPTATASPTPSATATATATATMTPSTTPTPTASPTRTTTPTPSPHPTVTITGSVEGGANPIANSSVTLYAPGKSGDGSTPIILGTATSAADGAFSLSFVPPSSAPLYVVAAGGNAGAGSNSAIKLMAAIGMSNSLPASSIVVNELTTVGSVWALAQFMSIATPQNLGASSTNQFGIPNAISATTNLFDLHNGSLPSFLPSVCSGGTPTGNCLTEEKLDTFADLIAACVATSGPSASFPGDCPSITSGSPACDQLFCYGATNDTLKAALAMALAPAVVNPTTGRSLPFGLATGGSPFQPILSATPNDLTLSLAFTAAGFSGVGIAIDNVGEVWFSGSTSIGEMSPSGALLSAGGFTGAGTVNAPNQLAIDSALSVWIPNNVGTLTELKPDGGFKANFAGNGLSGSDTAAIDSLGNVWISNKTSGAVVKVSPSGAFLSGKTGFTGGGLSTPHGLALDAFNDVWVGNGNGTLTELDFNGDAVAGSPFTGGGLNNTHQVALDPSGNVWAANKGNDSVSEFASNGAAISGTNGFTGGGLSAPNGIAVDAAGRVFVSDQGPGGAGVAMTALDSKGNALSPAAGFLGAGLNSPHSLAIDASGNVWINNDNGATVTEFLGIAAPVRTPLQGLPTVP